ncbi:MAG: hypothetical protein AAFW69_07855, partial [Pseudomonadota bacterium]
QIILITLVPFAAVWMFVLEPEVLPTIRAALNLDGAAFKTLGARAATNAPILLGLLWLGFTVAYGIMGVPAAATAANAANRSPHHELIWGAGMQGRRLAFLSCVIIGAPALLIASLSGPVLSAMSGALEEIAAAATSGQFGETSDDIESALPETLLGDIERGLATLALIGLYVLFIPVILASGAARAYRDTLRGIEEERRLHAETTLGPQYDIDDLRALRARRQEATRLAGESYDGDAQG